MMKQKITIIKLIQKIILMLPHIPCQLINFRNPAITKMIKMTSTMVPTSRHKIAGSNILSTKLKNKIRTIQNNIGILLSVFCKLPVSSFIIAQFAFIFKSYSRFLR